MKTSEVQDATDYSCYTDKQYNNYINDINNGVYTNNNLTLVNFDLGQIYNSQKFTESDELFAGLPTRQNGGGHLRRGETQRLAPGVPKGRALGPGGL